MKWFFLFIILACASEAALTQRVAQVTLAMPQQPPAAAPGTYTFEPAFAGVIFTNPICIRTPPGETNRLFVAERAGRLIVITNLVAPDRGVFLDLSSTVNQAGEGGLLGFDFHPGYATNGYFYVFYTLNANNASGNGFHNRLSRFQVNPTNAHQAPAGSEQILFSQYDQASNHNGGDVHFGPDGYLYTGLGDEGGGNDAYDNSQQIAKDFFSAMLRLDVDKKPGSLFPHPHGALNGATNYMIPPDNPFMGATQFNGVAVNPLQVRTEFYAVGLRNPWRFSFDPATGELYVGDVGQNTREEIDLLVKGGNYGWKWREGKIANPSFPTPPPGFTNAMDPILDYARGGGTNQGYSITGGVVYRGDRFPGLFGKYIFADYASGNVWYLTHNGTNATAFQRMTGLNTIITFGVDPRNGDVLAGRLATTGLQRLIQSDSGVGSFPYTLADTGVFSDLPLLTPHEGIVPFDINVPFWSDGADKRRWFSIPDTNQIMQFHPEAPWVFPTGTVWIKHFDLFLTNGMPSSARRVETRILVKNSSPAGGYGVTYRWGGSSTNAILVPEEGLIEPFIVYQNGVTVTQVWRYPSRSECLMCHPAAGGFAMGFNTPQLNRAMDYDGDLTNQLGALAAAGYIDADLDDTLHTLRALAHATNTTYSLSYRARSYLQANCAHCHIPGGVAPYSWDARIFTPLSQASLLEAPLLNDGGNTTNRVIRRGDPAHSMILTRINTSGAGRMPPIGSHVIDTQSVALITAWISELSTHQTFAEWQIQHFSSTSDPDAQPTEDPDVDGVSNEMEYLTGTHPWDDEDAWTMRVRLSTGTPHLDFDRIADRGFEVQYSTNLIDAAAWRILNAPENTPLFGAATEAVSMQDSLATNRPATYYRMRIYEP